MSHSGIIVESVTPLHHSLLYMLSQSWHYEILLFSYLPVVNCLIYLSQDDKVKCPPFHPSIIALLQLELLYCSLIAMNLFIFFITFRYFCLCRKCPTFHLVFQGNLFITICLLFSICHLENLSFTFRCFLGVYFV